MSEQRLHDVDYLRERADITYEEAVQVLEENGGDVMQALVALEKQGRVRAAEGSQAGGRQCDGNDAKEKATSFFRKACQTRLVIERQREDGDPETIANLSAPYAVAVTVLAPYIAIGSAVLTVAAGYHVKVKKEGQK